MIHKKDDNTPSPLVRPADPREAATIPEIRRPREVSPASEQCLNSVKFRVIAGKPVKFETNKQTPPVPMQNSSPHSIRNVLSQPPAAASAATCTATNDSPTLLPSAGQVPTVQISPVITIPVVPIARVITSAEATHAPSRDPRLRSRPVEKVDTAPPARSISPDSTNDSMPQLPPSHLASPVIDSDSEEPLPPTKPSGSLPPEWKNLDEQALLELLDTRIAENHQIVEWLRNRKDCARPT